MEKDPFCGMEVADTSDTEQYEYKGKTYYFCTALCRIQFEHDPERYIIEDDKDEQTIHQRSK